MEQIAWFKAIKGRFACRDIVFFYAVRQDGTIKSVDTFRNKTSTINSFSSKPMTLEVSTKRAYDKAFNKALKS